MLLEENACFGVSCYLCFQFQDLCFVFNYLFLSVPHIFISFNFSLHNLDFILYRVTELSQKLRSVLNEFIFALVESFYIGEDMLMIEKSVSNFHALFLKLLLSYQQSFLQMKSKKNNFQIQTKLGSGSYGVIFKAINKSSKEVCVLKQITLNRLSEKARKSAVNEATIMGKLSHPYIVRYQQSFIQENTLNIVMEYCDNGDLSVYLKMQNKKPLKEEKIWKFFIQICSGLEYIHKNRILHRDIKTLNIFLNKNQQVKIGDLGVAKMLTSNEFAQTMVGTPFYLSPELCEEKPYNEKSDIWALGCLLYELCTFQHPFQAQNQASLILKIIRGKYNPIPEFYSKDLKDMIDMCLQRDYKRRPTAGNILARPKILELISQFKIDKTIQEHIQKANKQAKEGKETKQTIQIKQVKKNEPKGNQLKTIEQNIKNNMTLAQAVDQRKANPIVKAMDEGKKQENILQKKIIIPKASQQKQKINNQIIDKKESKNEFVSNLEKLIEDDNRKKVKQNVSYEIPWKDNEIIKKQNQAKINSNPLNQFCQKRGSVDNAQLFVNQQLREPKRNISSALQVAKKQKEAPKETLQIVNKNIINNKPPLPKPQSQNPDKKQIIKVKNQKVIPPKIYESQKNVGKPSGIIKSGGFAIDLDSKQRQASHSKQKGNAEVIRIQQKKPSIYAPQSKVEKEEPKQLFGPSPSIKHKSEKHLIKSPQNIFVVESKKQIEKSMVLPNKKDQKQIQNKPVSRVRKGSKNQLSRNAKNVARYHEVTKEEEDLVMNLPNKINNNQDSSDEQIQKNNSKSDSSLIRDLKAKTKGKFQLKEIDNELILQKYEDIIKNQSTNLNESSSDSEKDKDHEQTFKNIDNLQEDEEQQKQKEQKVLEFNEDQVLQEITYNLRKDSGNSSQPIQQQLDQQKREEDDLQQVQNLQNQFESEQFNQNTEMTSQWSFDEEPELPLLEDKQSPYFQENNPYLVEEEERLEDKKNHLQIKLKENMKREDQINKLMQIKIDQCRHFVPNQQSFQEILQFFRKKINMEDEYTDEDQREVQTFLRKKGLTDQRKFQNIYKIMHFEMQMQNTRKIIQRICKKLSQLEQEGS